MTTPILIIGCGRMGGAFARAWRATHRVLAYDPAATLPEGVEALGGLDAIPPRAIVLLAVKPQLFPDVAPALRAHLGEGHVVVSIAAGITLATLRTLLGAAPALVRAMPNTPVAVGKGMTAAVAEAALDPGVAEALGRLFGETGAFLWLDAEDQLDAVTAISGSGPAYFFRFAEALAAAGAAQGLPAPVAYELARATLAGAGALAGPGTDLAGLRAEVTSPGGTTAAALAAMNAGGIDALALAGVGAAVRRAGELAAEAAR
ncbi:pyrroline-5-carboxylate reductase [Sphingomonas sp. HITSZ_GF]|uniref:pyrroline-5-carboxylate reductase n=1 Tax=Sphingomonas sp. HITSZ_GF TaxID=3037247 RepID=UPI00240E4011|nr:pyrroline-5-carboxylate reductase [Sphingomonas sp. HITSZ_GF]MDG2534157.1 pyrroline-5-carboxylate reductase [Sphingomonas sp. HITSZ_GF]